MLESRCQRNKAKRTIWNNIKAKALLHKNCSFGVSDFLAETLQTRREWDVHSNTEIMNLSTNAVSRNIPFRNKENKAFSG